MKTGTLESVAPSSSPRNLVLILRVAPRSCPRRYVGGSRRPDQDPRGPNKYLTIYIVFWVSTLPELPCVVPFEGSVPRIQPKSITNPKKELQMGVQVGIVIVVLGRYLIVELLDPSGGGTVDSTAEVGKGRRSSF